MRHAPRRGETRVTDRQGTRSEGKGGADVDFCSG